jgi:hypothetical protein
MLLIYAEKAQQQIDVSPVPVQPLSVPAILLRNVGQSLSEKSPLNRVLIQRICSTVSKQNQQSSGEARPLIKHLNSHSF